MFLSRAKDSLGDRYSAKRDPFAIESSSPNCTLIMSPYLPVLNICHCIAKKFGMKVSTSGSNGAAWWAAMNQAKITNKFNIEGVSACIFAQCIRYVHMRGKLTNFPELLHEVWQFDRASERYMRKIHGFSPAPDRPVGQLSSAGDSVYNSSGNRIPEIIEYPEYI